MVPMAAVVVAAAVVVVAEEAAAAAAAAAQATRATAAVTTQATATASDLPQSRSCRSVRSEEEVSPNQKLHAMRKKESAREKRLKIDRGAEILGARRSRIGP
jgi:hypothetical protein